MGRRRRQKRVSEQVELEITRLSHDGRGIAERDGKTVFVQGGLPGETAEVEIQLKKSRFEEGKVINVLTASPERVEPICAHTERCGGCSLQHLAGDAQIALKQQTLLDQFEHFGSVAPEQILEPVTGSDRAYRRKARLGVRYVTKRDEILVGFREKGNSFIADIESCPMLEPQIGEQLMAFRALIAQLSIYKNVPQIEVAIGDDASAIIVRHLEPFSDADLTLLVEFVQQQGLQLYLQPGGPDSLQKIWPDDQRQRLSYRLPDFDLEMLFHPLDFTQVNPLINRKMVSKALAMLDPQPGEKILDLFCGLGNFTLPLATSGAEVIGVEGSAAMVDRGYENASHNQLGNVQFYAADLTADFTQEAWAQQRFDKILIDPPRSGALDIIRHLPVFDAQRVVYVSCNPATLARDAGELQKQGFVMKSAGVLDMFPHTNHVESIAWFEKPAD